MEKSKKDSPVVHGEPAWKKRQREQQKLERKMMLWKVLAVAAVIVIIGLFGYMSSMGIKRMNERKHNEKPSDGIARVEGKRIVKINGREQRILSFSLTTQRFDRPVSDKEYESVNKGDDLKVQYTGVPQFGTAKVLSWQPLKVTH